MRGNVLIVEDDQAIAEVFADIMEDEGCASRIVETGEQAIAVLQEHWADLVFLDIGLPVVDGEGVLVLTDLTDGPIPPIIVITATAAVNETHLTRLGATCVLYKPFELNDVLSIMKEHLPDEPAKD